ncbi:MAG: hypothetical protein E7326_03860 [Clostridiales bacterium]|nr:hypothetical protein [Clostridiales bacterium]
MKIRRLAAWMLALALLTAAAGYAETQENAAHNRSRINELLKNSTFYFLDESEALAPYYQLADARRQAILHSPTAIVKADTFIPGETYTGVAYYVSHNGDDKNDGLSPETPLRTLRQLRLKCCLAPGDAVFFERGGIYPVVNRPLMLWDQVTYSAYGEGPKPVLTMAQENSAREECWELWYEGENGEKIWRYYLQVGDVAAVIFDDESCARRILEWPTPKGWLALDIQEKDPAHGDPAVGDICGRWQMQSAQEFRTVEAQLTENLTYVSRSPLDEFKKYPFDYDQGLRVGDLFLRCDAGNPGTCYDDIMVIAVQRADTPGDTHFAQVLDGGHAAGWVLDNLSIKGFTGNAIGGDRVITDRALIQNCSVEWGGQTLCAGWIKHSWPQYDGSVAVDNIFCVAKNATIRNNYFRQCSHAFMFESGQNPVSGMGAYIAEGNLIEDCAQGTRTYMGSDGDALSFDHVLIRDNIILNTGSGMTSYLCFEEQVAVDLGTNPVQYARHIEVCDNILLGSSQAIFRIPDSTQVEIDIHDNVIAQDRDKALITEFQWFRSNELIWYMMKDAK